MADATVLQLPARQMLTDDVYDTLRTALLSQQFAPGSRINLEELGRTLRASNTPIRQALARLAAEGLVEKVPYKGFAVAAEIDQKTFDDIFESRMLLEPFVAASATSAVSDVDLRELREALEYEIAPGSSPDELVRKGVDSDERFHGGLARLAGNGIIADQLARLRFQTRSYRSLFSQNDFAELARQEHLQILQAVAAGNPEGAAAQMRLHLREAHERALAPRTSS